MWVSLAIAACFTGWGLGARSAVADPAPLSVYTFDDLNEGLVDGQDNWKSVNTGSAGVNQTFQVLTPGSSTPANGGVQNTRVIGWDGTKTLRFPFGGSAVGARASRVNNSRFSTPSFQTGDVYVVEFEMQHPCWGGSFGLGFDKDGNGDITGASEEGISFQAAECGDRRQLTKPDGTVVDGSATIGSFNRYQIAIDRSANNGAGSASVWFLDLSAGATEWKPITELQDVNMGFDRGTDNKNPANWNGIFLHSESYDPSGLYDNIAFRRVAPSARSVAFDATKVGATSTKRVTVAGDQLRGKLSATLTGDYVFAGGAKTSSDVTDGSALDVVFRPLDTGTRTGTLVLQGEDMAAPLTIALSGDGQAIDSKAFTLIHENDSESLGNTVGEISSGLDIALTSVDNTNGNWQYKLAGATVWQDVDSTTGTVVDLSNRALLLDKDAQLRFVPEAGWHGTASVKYKVWFKDSAGMQLDGVDDYVSVTGLGTAYSSITFEGWVRLDSFSDQFNVLLNADSWVNGDLHIQLYKGTPTKMEVAVNGISSAHPRFDYDFNSRIGKWTHIAVSINRATGEYRLYVNGSYVEHKYATGVPALNVGSFTIGAWNSDANGAMQRLSKGMFSDFRLWSTVRTDNEIHDEMANGSLAGDETGLIGNWRFNEGTGSTIGDFAGVKHDGAVHGDAVWVSSSGQLADTTSGEGTYSAYVATSQLTVEQSPVVSFDTGGGTAVSSQSVDYNGHATQPAADPTKTGYTFAGWYADSMYATAFDFAATAITGATTVYAKWTINRYTVSFDTAGGTSVAGQSVDYNGQATKPAADPTKTGYTFAGWYTDNTFATAFDFAATSITGATTVYTKWTINSYTVSFDSGGGTAVADQSVDYNGYATQPVADPTRAGYTFAGWYTDNTYATPFDFTSTAITGATTVYS
ncbi:MAG: multidomain protein with s-layer y region, ig motif, i-set domain, pkd domain, partial [Paenibacillaceae bacterium]|nr:multidomain protein with s-layer y region, ig motif, i-set domain, pkd domain [Paenibacillaceae bacterium]